MAWRRSWQPTPVFLPGQSHGQRSLAGYSPLGCRIWHDWSDLAQHICIYIKHINTSQPQSPARVGPWLFQIWGSCDSVGPVNVLATYRRDHKIIMRRHSHSRLSFHLWEAATGSCGMLYLDLEYLWQWPSSLPTWGTLGKSSAWPQWVGVWQEDVEASSVTLEVSPASAIWFCSD